jgi:cyclic pyranopterin phosphate synthase
VEDRFGHRISYLRISVTDRCNERCVYCMPQEEQEWLPRAEVLSYEEVLRLVRVAVGLGVSKFRVTGGEPLVRRDITRFFAELGRVPGVADLGVSTNGTRLAVPDPCDPNRSTAAALVAAGVRSANISLDTLDRAAYAATTGRDFLPDVLDGIDAATEAGFERVKLNAVLVRGQSEDQLLPLVEFAAARGALLRFIELMPVSTTDVLHERRFLSAAEAKRGLAAALGGPLVPRPDVRTNGPASYYQLPRTNQLVGFIGAMSDLHFCETCNKLRLTCDGKLRPCLGSHLEFDIKSPLRAGASDDELAGFFRAVVERKPMAHDFRDGYQPGRKMVAIGG